MCVTLKAEMIKSSLPLTHSLPKMLVLCRMKYKMLQLKRKKFFEITTHRAHSIYCSFLYFNRSIVRSTPLLILLRLPTSMYLDLVPNERSEEPSDGEQSNLLLFHYYSMQIIVECNI